MEALRILMRSMTGASMLATAHAIELASIIFLNFSLFSGRTCFESLSPGQRKPSGKITAAANTGPARQPRPASSQPASSLPFVRYGLRAMRTRIRKKAEGKKAEAKAKETKSFKLSKHKPHK